MQRRPTIKDVPDHVDARILMLELLHLRWELNGWHREEHQWLSSFRSKVGDLARLSLIVIPVLLSAAIAYIVVTP